MTPKLPNVFSPETGVTFRMISNYDKKDNNFVKFDKKRLLNKIKKSFVIKKEPVKNNFTFPSRNRKHDRVSQRTKYNPSMPSFTGFES